MGILKTLYGEILGTYYVGCPAQFLCINVVSCMKVAVRPIKPGVSPVQLYIILWLLIT